MSSWQTPKTNWGQPGQTVPGADDFNRIEGNTQYLKDEVEQVSDELTSHKAENATLNQLGHVKHGVFTTTIWSAEWTGITAPFTQVKTISGILATDTPIVDVIMSGTYATDEARQEAWSNIYRITTANNSITLYATEKPTVSLPIQIKVVR